MTPVGPLPAEVGNGGSGFHGEVAVRVRQLLQEHSDLVAAFNLLLAKLDADAGVTDSNYASTLGIA
jgi:hypothetical protein